METRPVFTSAFGPKFKVTLEKWDAALTRDRQNLSVSDHPSAASGESAAALTQGVLHFLFKERSQPAVTPSNS